MLIKNHPIFFVKICSEPGFFDGTFEGDKNRNPGSRGFHRSQKEGTPARPPGREINRTAWVGGSSNTKKPSSGGSDHGDFLNVNFGSSFANGGEPCNDNHGGFQRPHYILLSWSKSR